MIKLSQYKDHQVQTKEELEQFIAHHSIEEQGSLLIEQGYVSKKRIQRFKREQSGN